MLVSVLLGLFLFVTANVAEESHQPCPTTWTFNEESKTCIKAYNEKKLPWKKARGKCQSMDGDLVVIRNSHMNDFVQGLLSLKRYWIGSRFNKTTKMMRYLDGEEVTPSYEAWAPRQPNNYRGIQECIEIIRKRGGLWNDRQCKRRNHFVCEKQAVEKKEIGPIEKCDQGWVYYDGDDTCLLYQKGVGVFQDEASKECHKWNRGSLVTIRDEKKDNFIKNMIPQTGRYTIWIGLKIYSVNKTSTWDEGTLLGEYHPFINPEEFPTENEVCVLYYSDMKKHLVGWRGMRCNTYAHYMCERPLHELPPV